MFIRRTRAPDILLMDAICEAADALWDDFGADEAAWLLAALSNLQHRSPPHLLNNLTGKLTQEMGGLRPSMLSLVAVSWAKLRCARGEAGPGTPFCILTCQLFCF